MQDTSTIDQKKVNDLFAARHGMVHVRDEVLDGVSGSKTFNRRDIKRLLTERQRHKNFDVIVVYDSSRLTRGGAYHASSIRHSFGKLDVLILSVMDPVPDGDFKDTIQSMIDTNNHLYSRRLAGYTARGIMQSVMRGTTEHIGRLPPGLDRLYLRPDGTPLMRLKYVGNKERHLIDEETGKILRVAKWGENAGPIYRMQPGERAVVVPGDPAAINAIRKVFELRYMHNWGFRRLGTLLTQMGIMPPMSRFWGVHGARGIVNNSLYLGWSYFLKQETGLFFKGNPDSPEPRKFDQSKYEDSGIDTTPRTRRPRSEWYYIENPYLKDVIIDPEVRKRAEEYLNSKFDTYHLPSDRTVRARDRHPHSRHFLSGIMREPKFEQNFTGHTGGAKGHKVRYYLLHAAKASGPAWCVSRRMIAAIQVEEAVLGVIRRVLSNQKLVLPIVKEYVKKVFSERQHDDQREQLEHELKSILAKIRAIYQTTTGAELIEHKPQLDALRTRREQIQRELAATPLNGLSNDPKVAVDLIMKRLAVYNGYMDGTKPKTFMDGEVLGKLKALVAAMCYRMELSLTTLTAKFELAVPEGLLTAPVEDLPDMCLTWRQGMTSPREAKIENWLVLGNFGLEMLEPFVEGGKKLRNSRPWIEVPA